jgi:hypothetical protein
MLLGLLLRCCGCDLNEQCPIPDWLRREGSWQTAPSLHRRAVMRQWMREGDRRRSRMTRRNDLESLSSPPDDWILRPNNVASGRLTTPRNGPGGALRPG